jgi:hypothetical protein
MIVPHAGTIMIDEPWRKRKASDRLSLWNVQNAMSGIIRRRKTVVMIPAGWS